MIAINGGWGEKHIIPAADSPAVGLTFEERGKTMKKILLATTVLAASASVAAAEVTVGGSGRMGVTYSDSAAAAAETNFSSRIRITFTASAETDSGLSFGGSIRADNAAGGNDGTAGSVFVSGAFGKITMGDVDGAAEMAVGDLNATSFAGVGDLNENAYLSNGGIAALLAPTMVGADVDTITNSNRPTVRYEYSAGALTVAVSMDAPNATFTVTDTAGLDTTDVTESVYALGVSYATDMFTVSLGHEVAKTTAEGTTKHTIVGASGTFSGVTVKATYGKLKASGTGALVDTNQYGLSAGYTMNGLTVTAFTRTVDDTADKVNSTGIGASYDLGGGAAFVGGFSVNDGGAADVATKRADIGVTFTF